MEGRGLLTWSDGRKYFGDFHEDRIHGRGTYTWANGDHYTGDYANDMRDGRGVYVWMDGSAYQVSLLANIIMSYALT